MITEDYVSFEVTKLLKEKGFDKDFDADIVKWYNVDKGDQNLCSLVDFRVYKCPSLAMMMKWLREVHNIHISVYPFNRKLPITENTSYTCDIATKKDSPMRGHLRGTWKTYEKAAEAAIEYCLENLI